jgi:histidinol-phosphatase
VSGATVLDFGAAWSAGFRRGTDVELRGWVQTALAWCDETDAIAMRHFRRDVVAERKPDRSFVTVADTSIEQLLRDRIGATFKKHGVVGEEFGTDAGGASVRWYIDPIDATHNYIRGVPVFATLMAVERDGELQAAVISAPALGQRWGGWRGGGAWAMSTHFTSDARRMTVSRIGELADAQVLYSSLTDLERSGGAPGMPALRAAAWRERGFGDFWGYTLLAEGAAEAMVEVGLKPWDAAAPLLLVEEAGGRATDLQGERTIASGSFLASNGRLHEEIRSMLTAPAATPLGAPAGSRATPGGAARGS